MKDCSTNASPNSNAMCDGVIEDLAPYTTNYSQSAADSGTNDSWWSAHFPAPTNVQTIMLYNVVNSGKLRV